MAVVTVRKGMLQAINRKLLVDGMEVPFPARTLPLLIRTASPRPPLVKGGRYAARRVITLHGSGVCFHMVRESLLFQRPGPTEERPAAASNTEAFKDSTSLKVATEPSGCTDWRRRFRCHSRPSFKAAKPVRPLPLKDPDYARSDF